MVAHAARSSAVVALAVACLLLRVADSSAQASPKGFPACSRERSRHARAVLDEFFHPVVDKNRFELPPACPFARAKDMYLEHERHKEVVRRTQYKSLYSDKTFKSEYYVDKHMDNRHADKIPAGADVCLAEYCDVLRCDAFRGWRATDAKARFEHALDAIGLHAHECDEASLEDARARCERVVARCFPSREERGEVDDAADAPGPPGAAGGGGGGGGGGRGAAPRRRGGGGPPPPPPPPAAARVLFQTALRVPDVR